MWCLSTCLWMSCRRCPQQRGAPGGPRPLTVPRPWRAPQMKLQLLAPARWVRWGAVLFIACRALGFSWDRASMMLLCLCYLHCDSRHKGLHWGPLPPQFLQAAVSAAVSWQHVRPTLCLLGSMKHRKMWKLSVSLTSNLSLGIFWWFLAACIDAFSTNGSSRLGLLCPCTFLSCNSTCGRRSLLQSGGSWIAADSLSAIHLPPPFSSASSWNGRAPSGQSFASFIAVLLNAGLKWMVAKLICMI